MQPLQLPALPPVHGLTGAGLNPQPQAAALEAPKKRASVLPPKRDWGDISSAAQGLSLAVLQLQQAQHEAGALPSGPPSGQQQPAGGPEEHKPGRVWRLDDGAPACSPGARLQQCTPPTAVPAQTLCSLLKASEMPVSQHQPQAELQQQGIRQVTTGVAAPGRAAAKSSAAGTGQV